MARARQLILAAFIVGWWLLIGCSIGVAVSWTTKALAERGLARGPRWAADMTAAWPHPLLPGYDKPDDWMRTREWWRRQDIGIWRAHPEYLIIQASYGLPFRNVGELMVVQNSYAGPMLLDLAGTSPRTGPLAGFPLTLRATGFFANGLVYGALTWWFIRGRRWLRARRRRKAGRCPECGETWSGTGEHSTCPACIEWKSRPRIRTWTRWKTSLSAPYWLTVGGAITLLIAWGGPYFGLLIGDHFMSRPRQPAAAWPGEVIAAARGGVPDFVDISDGWWGSTENYSRGFEHVTQVRAGAPFPCCAGVSSATTRYSVLGTALPPARSVERYWFITIPRVVTLSLPNRFLWVGFGLNAVFWAVLAWFAWRGPAAIRAWRWRRTGRCSVCGYNLQGLPVGTRCPECGAVPPRASGTPVAAVVGAQSAPRDASGTLPP